MEKLVSIIMPTYNRVNLIGRAIESVLKQSYSNWELFIVDDYGNDTTEEFIKQKYRDNTRSMVLPPLQCRFFQVLSLIIV